MPALAAVQNAEPFLPESLTKIRSRFSTEFSTVVLKTSSASIAVNKKSRPKGAALLQILRCRSSASHFFQELLVNVEIGVYVLHVILIFECFHEPDHRVGGLTLKFNVVLWNHRDAG
jgi:hypothetical protein